MRISILLRENSNEIKGQLHDPVGDNLRKELQYRLREDLHHVAIALEETGRQFHAESLEIIDIFELPAADLHRPGDPPTSKTYDHALFKAALLLAWYSVTHGDIRDIPQGELLQLILVANGIHRSGNNEKADKLVALARDIRDKLLGITEWD